MLYNATNCPRSRETQTARRARAAHLASAASTASFAVALAGIPSNLRAPSAGSMPLSSAAASAVQPASVTWVCMRSSSLSFFSPPVGSGSAPAGGESGATRAAIMPSSPSGLPMRKRRASAGSRRAVFRRGCLLSSIYRCVIRETTQTGCPWSRPRVYLSLYLSLSIYRAYEVRARSDGVLQLARCSKRWRGGHEPRHKARTVGVATAERTWSGPRHSHVLLP